MMREKFTSKVTALRPDHIHVGYMKGPMRQLSNHWRFIEQPDGTCLIDFYVDFEFRNAILKGIIGLVFNEAMQRIVRAFEDRARALYG